jgi:hypothetical protein
MNNETGSAHGCGHRQRHPHAAMRPLRLSELPAWSPWPVRLLGLDGFQVPHRDVDKIEAEYNQDKWLKCLEAFRDSQGTMDARALRLFGYGGNAQQVRAAVHRGRLVTATVETLLDAYDRILADAMAASIAGSRTVVELGASFGQILWGLAQRFPDRAYRGGEYSENAVTLAQELYGPGYKSGGPDIAVSRLNFYDDAYEVLERAEGPVTVFTSQAIEQIPSAAHIIDVLAKYRDKIVSVFHLEPSYELYDDSLLGLMRRRYIEINDYNRDLIGALQGRSDVRILRLEPEVIGWNPFNALALVHWTFRRG